MWELLISVILLIYLIGYVWTCWLMIFEKLSGVKDRTLWQAGITIIFWPIALYLYNKKK